MIKVVIQVSLIATQGSVSVRLNDNTPELIQNLDGEEVSIQSDVELESDTWYSMMLERYVLHSIQHCAL